MYTKVRPRSTCLHQLKTKSEISAATVFLQKMEGVIFWQLMRYFMNFGSHINEEMRGFLFNFHILSILRLFSLISILLS